MIKPAPGILLIAEPFLKDPNFLRTVILLCEHQQEGSFGLVLNRKFEKKLSDILPDIGDSALPVYYGGPVQMDTLHYVHQYPDLVPDSQKISENVYWGGNFETITALLKANELDEKKIRFFIGYSGWSEGQLNSEITENSWLTTDANMGLIFQTSHKEVWKKSVQQLGGDYEMMINFPIDPQLN